MPRSPRQQLGRIAHYGAITLRRAARVLDGFAAPRSIDTRSDLHAFWRSPHPEGNDPVDYIPLTERSAALAELITDLPKDAKILEVGCNVGRNLAHLRDRGWTNVEGIEISPHAVEMLRETYPQLRDNRIQVGSAEDLLPTFADDEFDLVFTMAVLEHIHPSSVSVFDDIARIGKWVLAIEPTLGHIGHRQFPHDIPELFTSRGKALVSRGPFLDAGDLAGYEAFSFR